MADIISFNEVKDREDGVFAIREDDGELKPMEEWEGSDWKTFFEGPMASIGKMIGCSPWDVFAEFMAGILNEALPAGED